MRLNATDEPISTAPGVPTAITIEVFNDADVIDGFGVELLGLEQSLPNGEALEPHIEVIPEQLSIFPDTSGVMTVLLTLPQGYPSGRDLAELRVRSVSDPDEIGVERIELDVEKVPSAEITPVPQTITGGRRTIFGLVLDNTGNVPLELAITVADAENVLEGPPGTELRADTAPAPGAETDTAAPTPPPPPFLVPLAPRERADIRLPVSARRPFVGAPVTRIVTFTADPGPDVPLEELEAVGTFTQKPLIPRAVLTILTLLLALALWGGLLLAGVDRTTDKVAADNAALASQQEQAAKDAADEAALATAGAISGTVSDTSGSPVGDAKVEAAGDGSASATTLTDDGTFELGKLPVPGTFSLTVAKEGFAPLTQEIELTEDAPAATGLALVLTPAGGTVAGTVSDEAGDPLADVIVTSTDSQGNAGPTAVTAGEGSVGYYTLGGLVAPETYTVVFSRSGFTDVTETVTVPEGDGVNLDVTMLVAPSVSIVGTVSENRLKRPECTPQTCPLAAATVTVSDAEGAEIASTTSAGEGSAPGSFTIAGLTPGTYTVTFAKEGYVPQVAQVDLVPGATTLDAVLDGLPGSISGVAPGCVRVEVRLRDLSQLNPSRSAQPAGSDGVYGLAELPTPAEYRVLFFGPESEGFRDIQLVDITLGPGEVREAVTATCSSSPDGGSGGGGAGDQVTTTPTIATSRRSPMTANSTSIQNGKRGSLGGTSKTVSGVTGSGSTGFI